MQIETAIKIESQSKCMMKGGIAQHRTSRKHQPQDGSVKQSNKLMIMQIIGSGTAHVLPDSCKDPHSRDQLVRKHLRCSTIAGQLPGGRVYIGLPAEEPRLSVLHALGQPQRMKLGYPNAGYYGQGGHRDAAGCGEGRRWSGFAKIRRFCLNMSLS